LYIARLLLKVFIFIRFCSVVVLRTKFLKYLELTASFTQAFPLKHSIGSISTYLHIAPSIVAGQKWRSHRKLIAPTFHLNVLKSFIELFNENSRNVVRKLRAEDGRTFDCHDYMSEATVEILLGK